MVNRSNNHCAYFPCHDGLEDCTFCYCPFYPCKDPAFGTNVTSKAGKKVWSCKDCNWIHRKEIVDKIFAAIGPLKTSLLRKSDGHTKKATVTFSRAKTGIIILGHGSRLMKANDTVRSAAREIRAVLGGKGLVEPAYLQLCKPDLQSVIKKAVKTGCSRVVIVPFFLFKGNHVSRDIPEVIKQESKMYPKVRFVFTKNIGNDPRIIDIVMARIREAVL